MTKLYEVELNSKGMPNFPRRRKCHSALKATGSRQKNTENLRFAQYVALVGIQIMSKAENYITQVRFRSFALSAEILWR